EIPASCFVKDRFSEAMPSGVATGDQMVRPLQRRAFSGQRLLPLAQGSQRAIDDQACRGRGAVLVCHDAQFLSFGTKTKHRAQEVMPVSGVNPCCAKYHVRRATVSQSVFTRKFAAPISPDGGCASVYGIRSRIRAVENVIRRIVKDQGIVRGRPCPNSANS